MAVGIKGWDTEYEEMVNIFSVTLRLELGVVAIGLRDTLGQNVQ